MMWVWLFILMGLLLHPAWFIVAFIVWIADSVT